MRSLGSVCMCIRNCLIRAVRITDLEASQMKEHRDDPTCEWPHTPSLFAFPVIGLALPEGREVCLASLSHLLPHTLLGYIVNLSHLWLLLLLRDICYFRYVNISNFATPKSFCCPGVICLFMMIIVIIYFILRF